MITGLSQTRVNTLSAKEPPVSRSHYFENLGFAEANRQDEGIFFFNCSRWLDPLRKFCFRITGTSGHAKKYAFVSKRMHTMIRSTLREPRSALAAHQKVHWMLVSGHIWTSGNVIWTEKNLKSCKVRTLQLKIWQNRAENGCFGSCFFVNGVRFRPFHHAIVNHTEMCNHGGYLALCSHWNTMLEVTQFSCISNKSPFSVETLDSFYVQFLPLWTLFVDENKHHKKAGCAFSLQDLAWPPSIRTDAPQIELQ